MITVLTKFLDINQLFDKTKQLAGVYCVNYTAVEAEDMQDRDGK